MDPVIATPTEAALAAASFSPRVQAAVPSANQTPVLTQYLRMAVRRKWVFVGAIVGALLVGLLATWLTTKLYTATTTVEIARDADKIVKVDGVDSGSNQFDLEFYQTQYGLLKSRALAEQVATDLKLADDPAFFDAMGKSKLSALFTDKQNQRLTTADHANRLRETATLLLDRIDVAPVRLSRLVNISFTSPSPALSAQVANAWAEHFINANLTRRFDATSYARKFLEERLEAVRLKLEDSERALVGYASSQQIINVGGTTGAGGVATADHPLIVDDLTALNSELASAVADRIRAETRANGARNGSDPESLTNAALAELRGKRAELAARYAELMVRFEPKYPAALAVASQVTQLDRAIAREEARIKDAIATGYRESVAREQALRARTEGLKTGLLDLRRRSIQYNIYQRDVDTNRQLYDGLLQRYKEIGVAGGVGTNNVSIVDPAQVPQLPSRPNLNLNLLLALLAGIVLGGVLAFALEQMDEAISDPSDAEREFGLPLLGAIPQISDATPMEGLEDRKSAIVEAYLSVLTNLDLSTSHGTPRSLMVTSTRPAEGKSTTAFALALTMARAKRRVILVDADMRSPSLHKMLELPNKAGLSSYLVGSDDIGGMVQRYGESSFAVMTAGPQPPNAAELLTGDRFKMLLDRLLQDFDHIVVDAPPVMGIADAPLIATQVEATLYTIESHGIRMSLARVALARLRTANARLIGLIVTKFVADRSKYGYGYDYGYSYGEPQQSKSNAWR